MAPEGPQTGELLDGPHLDRPVVGTAKQRIQVVQQQQVPQQRRVPRQLSHLLSLLQIVDVYVRVAPAADLPVVYHDQTHDLTLLRFL